MTDRHRVLIVSRELPPSIGPHPIRVAKLAKYLPDFGWDPTILTVPLDHVVLRDDELATEMGDIPVVRVPRLLARALPPVSHLDSRPENASGSNKDSSGAAVPRDPSPRPYGRRSRLRVSGKMLVPDSAVLWALPASRRAAALAKGFDAVLTTAPPFSTHLVGNDLARRHGIPWVAEYRDNWTTNPLYRRSAPIQWFNRRLERRFLAAAGAVVVVSEAAAAELRSSFPGLDAKIHVARNGFDPEDLPATGGRPETFEIAYTGSLEARRDPRPFFSALAQLTERRPEIRGAISLHLMGWVVDWAIDAANEALGKEHVTFDGLLSHKEALDRASRAAVLLGITTRMEAGGAGLTSKLFEYVGLRRPVLMLAPEGPARQLVRESGCGVGADPDDVEAMIAAVGKLFDEWRRRTERVAPDEFISGLTRRATAQSVAAALDAALVAGRRDAV
jgi:glycosyltransferase involved in cell wall biosynthesis